MDTSSQVSPQVSILDDAEPDNLTLEEVSVPVENLGLGTSILPRDVIQLQEEAGKALGCLLATRSSLNACHRKQVSDFVMALFQNKSKTTKAVQEAKTLCTCTTRESKACQAMYINKAEARYAACIKEAKAHYVSIIAEVENHCSVAIRKAESCGAKQAHSIQQSHAEGMQCLETEAIGEEGKDHLSFLATCRAALWASHPKDCGVLVTHFHLLLGNASAHSIKHPPYLLLNTNLPHWLLILLPPWHLGHQPCPNVNTPPPTRLYPSSIGSHPKSGP